MPLLALIVKRRSVLPAAPVVRKVPPFSTRFAAALVAALAMSGGWLIRAQDETRAGEWRSSGGDSTYKRYSPLAQITRDNVKNLRVVWRRPALDPALKEQFRNSGRTTTSARRPP